MERVSPFANGSQYMDWLASNCESCAKAAPPDVAWDDWEQKPCEIEKALSIAAICDGRITPEIADRMGYTCQLATDPKRVGFYNWPCREWCGQNGATAWTRLTAEQREKYGWPKEEVEQTELELKGTLR